MAGTCLEQALTQIVVGIFGSFIQVLAEVIGMLCLIPLTALQSLFGAVANVPSSPHRGFRLDSSGDRPRHFKDSILPGERAASPETRRLVLDILDAFLESEISLESDQDENDLVELLRGGSKDIQDQYKRSYIRVGIPFSRGDEICQSELESQLLAIDHMIIWPLEHLADEKAKLTKPVPVGKKLEWIRKDVYSLFGFFAQYFAIWFLYSLGTIAMKHMKPIISPWPLINHRKEQQISINRLRAEIKDQVKAISDSTLLSLTRLSDRVEWATEFRALPPKPEVSQGSVMLSASTSSTSLVTEPQEKRAWLSKHNPFQRKENRHKQNLSLFTFTELPSSYSFRLIQLVAKPNKKLVECRMQTFSITNAPSYWALSYCWGELGAKVDIICNNQRLKVSAGLGQALEQLLSSTVVDSCWLWIDQVCINQENPSERTDQVRIMKVIYQRASKVLVWLGPKDQHTDIAVQVLQEAALPTRSTDSLNRDVTKHRSLWRSRKGDKWDSLHQFLSRPWFRRAWIVQEVVVPKNEIVILCGDADIRWKTFLKAAVALVSNHRTDRKLQELLKPIQNIQSLTAEAGLWDLSSLLLMTRLTRATDPRDKIFAFLGLSGETEQPDQWPKALRPDYKRPIKAVFRDATRYCIETSQSLSILSAVDHSSNPLIGKTYELPSWVPRWDAEMFPSEMSLYKVDRNEKDWKLRVEINHNATDSLKVDIKEAEDEDILILKGIRIETIEYCMNPHRFSDLCGSYQQPCTCASTQKFDPGAQSILDLWETCVSRLSRSNDIHGVAECVLSATTAGQTLSTHLALPLFWSYLLAVANHVPSQSRERFYQSLGSERASIHKYAHENWEIYVDSSKLSEDRQLFVTKAGQLGLGPKNIAKGDVVCILLGGRKPFVLHPCEDDWKMVGECYIHDLMDGSYVRRWQKSQRSSEWFHII